MLSTDKHKYQVLILYLTDRNTKYTKQCSVTLLCTYKTQKRLIHLFTYVYTNLFTCTTGTGALVVGTGALMVGTGALVVGTGALVLGTVHGEF